MKPTLYMTIGISGSGKSTYLNKNFKKSNIVSPDEIRKQLTGDISNQTRNKEVFEIAFKNIIDIIKKTGYAVLDATNVSSYGRSDFISKAKSEIPELKTTALIFNANPEISKKRIHRDILSNKDRSNVPPDAVDRQYMQFKSGYSDIKKQFDTLTHVNEHKIKLENMLK